MEFRSEAAREIFLAYYDEWITNKWPVTAESFVAETSWGATWGMVSGPKDAPPLLLLPGAHSTALAFTTNIEVLSKNYRVYAVDNIADYGRSVPIRTPATGPEFVDWLDEVIDALAFSDPINLGGLSFGGWITSLYTLDHPERVSKLVLLAPAATIQPFRILFLLRGIFSTLPFRWGTKLLMYYLLGDAKKDPEQRKFADDAIEAMTLAKQSYKLQTSIVQPTVLSDEQLEQLSATPTLILIGEREKLYSAKKAQLRLQQLATHIQIEIIPNAGHLFTATHALEVNALLETFLAMPNKEN